MGIHQPIRQELLTCPCTCRTLPYHFAISSARQIAAQSVLREARFQDLCSLRFWFVSYDNVPLRDDILDEFESGFCLTITVEAGASQDAPLWSPEIAARFNATEGDVAFL